jgi:hypothetical protein
MDHYVAIDNVCAWPNLTLMPNGDVVATIFNQPCHGKWEGDVECWASTDGGRLWRLRGVPAPHEPGTNRMDVAAGLAHDGTFVVLSSGTALKEESLPDRILPCWACLSRDEGRTWEHSETVAVPEGHDFVIPFGDIVCLPDGRLAATCYTCDEDGTQNSYVMFSPDGGRTWGDAVVIGSGDYNETDTLRLRDGRWLAVCRTAKTEEQHLELFVSEDEGQSWDRKGALSSALQIPGHLSLLADGRVLLVHGLRNLGLFGVAARFSEDEGETWLPPFVLVNLDNPADCGYPSSVQVEDGTIVTAYYASRIPTHMRYHMGVIRWFREKGEWTIK